MLGALRVLFILGFFALLSSLSTSAGGNEALVSAPSDAGSLEADFDAVILEVQNQLLAAPEASYVYLTHWIKVYNSAQDRPKARAPQTPQRLTAADSFAHDSNKSWRPNGFPVVSPLWGHSMPYSFADPSRFRPPAPPLQGEAFEASIENVLIYGDLFSEVRTPEQSLISAFWANGRSTETPPGRWNVIALEGSRHLPKAKRIELMLRLNIALYDAGIAAWDAKYHYSYWRPQTAIAATDVEYSDWEPMMQPPFHPEYVSGHSAFSGAGSAILEHYLGASDFCVIAKELANLKRCFSGFTQAAEEAGLSRIYGGIHFDFSNQAGLKLGRDVAAHVISTVSLP